MKLNVITLFNFFTTLWIAYEGGGTYIVYTIYG